MPAPVWSTTFAKRARPRSRLTGTQWADKYRYVAPGTSPEPGQWRTSRVPYLQEPMDCATDSSTEITVMMCSSQIGKSEFILNIMGYYADQEPAPQLMLQPTVEAAEAFSKERIEPTFQYSEGLRGKLDDGKDGRGTSRKKSTTIRMKHYPGGYLALVGANSPAGLASRPIRVMLADEVDRYSFTKEGDPLKLAIQRTTNFHNRKICLVSTPTIDGHSKIQEWWDKSDQRYYHVPCPHCGTSQRLKWAQVKWDKDENGNALPETAHYECESCAGHIGDRHKSAMLASGYWQATHPRRKIAGFHLSSLYSPWVKFEALAAEFIEVNKNRDKKGLMEFVNLKLGEPWIEQQSDLDYEHLHRRREYYGAELPENVLILTAGVDVQDDRLEIETVGWGIGRESWGVEYHTIYGDPAQPQIWRELDEYLQRNWSYEDGNALGIAATCIDSGGHYTTEVYEFCKPREARRIFAIKGDGGAGKPYIANPTRTNRVGAALFKLGVDTGKATIMARVRIEDEGPGYCHWPREGERGYDEEYFKGLLSEQLQFKYINGQTQAKWVQIRDRNEPLDLRNYATAALEILKPNLEWLAEQEQRGAVYAQHSLPRANRRRGVISRGVL